MLRIMLLILSIFVPVSTIAEPTVDACQPIGTEYYEKYRKLILDYAVVTYDSSMTGKVTTVAVNPDNEKVAVFHIFLDDGVICLLDMGSFWQPE